MKYLNRNFILALTLATIASVAYQNFFTQTQPPSLPGLGPARELDLVRSGSAAKIISSSANKEEPKPIHTQKLVQPAQVEGTARQVGPVKSEDVGKKYIRVRLAQIDVEFMKNLKTFSTRIGDPDFIVYYQHLKSEKDRKISDYFRQRNSIQPSASADYEVEVFGKLRALETEFEASVHEYLGDKNFDEYANLKDQTRSKSFEAAQKLNQTSAKGDF